MSFFRSFLLLFFISLSVASGLLFIAYKGENNSNISGYAVISTDASLDDEIIIERLIVGNHNFAGSPVSESTQWVLLDEFDSLGVIPLNRFAQRIYPFDPRNDGYAERLRDIFIEGDRRFVYIPLNPSAINNVERQINELLAGIPFSAEYFGIEKPLRLFFIAFAISSLVLIIIYFIRKRVNPGVFYTISVLPVLSSLSFFGVYGFVLAALLIGLVVMFHEPLKELIAVLCFPKENNSSGNRKNKIKLIFENAFEPYKLNFLLLPLFTAAIIAIPVAARLKLLNIFLIFISVCIVFFISVFVYTLSRNGRKRFVPVQIIKQRFVDFSFSVYMLPFAAAASIVMMLTPHISNAYVSSRKFDHIIDEHEYYAHLYYQASFSKLPLGTHGERANAVYSEYFWDEDGLLSPLNYVSLNNMDDINFSDFPPFPLKHLMEFFESVNNLESIDSPPLTVRNLEFISISILFLFIIPGFAVKGRLSYQAESLKRAKINLQRKEFVLDRRKIFLSGSRNNFHAKKEA